MVSHLYPLKQLTQLALYFQTLAFNHLQDEVRHFDRANADGVLLATYMLRGLCDDESDSCFKIAPRHH